MKTKHLKVRRQFDKKDCNMLKELRNYKRKLFLPPPQKQAKAQPTF